MVGSALVGSDVVGSDVDMHIAVDGSCWGGQERGVAVSTRRLWSGYLERRPALSVTEFEPASRLTCRPLAGSSRFVWQQFVLPSLVRARGIELLYCPCYTAPLAVSCRLVVSVHDLIAWTHPRLAGWRNAFHLRMLVGNAVRRAAAVCVPTEFVRRAVIEQFEISPRKVFVVPWGVDAEITPLPRADAARQLRRRFGVDEPFALFCGCIESKKNLLTAIHAASEAGIQLLIAGPWISSSSAVLPEKCSSAGSGWRYLGYVSTSDLSALYSAATALMFPSFAEGFGLPPLEAMRCGCPVMASDIPALREVCGGAAMHIPPGDTVAWAAGLRTIAADRSLRESLRIGGPARAAQFKWAGAIDSFDEALRYAA